MNKTTTYQLYAQRIFSFHWRESIAFYRDTIGLSLAFLDESAGWAAFDIGGASLAIERQDKSDPESAVLVGRFIGLSLAVDDIHQCYHTLVAKGVQFTAQPEAQPWGGTLVHFKDPDDNIMTLVSVDYS